MYLYPKVKQFLDENPEINVLVTENPTLSMVMRILSSQSPYDITNGDWDRMGFEIENLYARIYRHLSSLKDIANFHLVDTSELFEKVNKFFYVVRGFQMLVINNLNWINNEALCLSFWVMVQNPKMFETIHEVDWGIK